jgi:hypothetical protein
MKPLSVPMKTVIKVLSNKQDPILWYPAGQLRLIYAALERRGLIRWVGDRIGGDPYVLTPAGRNYVTEMRREGM